MAFSNLSLAKEKKKDEFYTSFEDINKEISHYEDKFKNKVVLCNCDDPFSSNFVKYFLMNFNRLELKELIAIGYPLENLSNNIKKSISYILRIKDTGKYLSRFQKDLDIENINNILNKENKEILYFTFGDITIDENEQNIKILNKEKKSNKINKKEYLAGDFRSNDSIELLKLCDIVVTNPPFSLFREFVSLIIKYKKQFLIIGNQNAITYKDIFPLIKENKMWLGYGFNGNVGFFESPYKDISTSTQHKDGKIRISGVMWFTNLEHSKRHQLLPLDLNCTYNGNEEKYPKYDNYDAININKTKEIPNDYQGIMGVPITFLSSFCPEQFEIVGLSSKENKGNVKRFHDNAYYNGYTRGKVITRIESNMPILNVNGYSGTLCQKENAPNLYQLYWRIFIKFKDVFIENNK